MKTNKSLIERIKLLENLIDEAYDIINGSNNPGWQWWCDKVIDLEMDVETVEDEVAELEDVEQGRCEMEEAALRKELRKEMWRRAALWPAFLLSAKGVQVR